MAADFKQRLKRRLSPRALMGVREVAAWPSVLRLLGSRNKLFLRFAPPGHYYSPLPDLRTVRRNASRIFTAPDHGGLPGIDLNEDAQLRLLETFAGIPGEMPFPDEPDAGFRYHLDNSYFSYGDCAALYALMRIGRPRRVVEVGSGYSSAAMLDINDRFLGGEVDLTFIEPHPERLRALLRNSDSSRCTVIESAVQDADPAVFSALEAGDILFIDSSHVAKIDSDVVHLLFRVLPSLADGVLVHLHDVPWPFEYPQIWVEQGKAWNEAYLLRAFLMYNGAFEIAYYAAYLAARHPAALSRALPAALRPPSDPVALSNSSIWLRKVPADRAAADPVSR